MGILFGLGIEVQGTSSLFTATIPGLLYFWIVGKDRGGRFFTFCMIDTIIIWRMDVTNTFDIYLGNSDLFTVIPRLIAFACNVGFGMALGTI